MVEKFKDAANILKAKLKKDDLEESLIQVTSQQNWQAPTNVLHQIANASYNYQKCQQITEFIWDKLKTKSSWRKILKTLNLVEFLLKNGPPSIVTAFKYETYHFKSFYDYSHFSDNAIDRGEAIRERAKAVVELLTNQQILEQQRNKAKTIREKMSGVSGGSGYGNYGGGDSKYQGYDSKSYGKNQTYSNTDKGNLNTAYGGYTHNQSTLAKYKQKQSKDAKGTQNKPQTKQADSRKPEQKAEAQEEQAPKPFSQPIKKLMKPGEKPAEKPPVNITGNQPVSAPTPSITQTKQPVSKPSSSLLDDDFLGFSQPTHTSAPVKQQAPILDQQNLINPMYGTTANLAAQNVQQTQSHQTAQSINQINLVNPMYGTTAPMAANNAQHQQAQNFNFASPMYSTPSHMPAQNQQMGYMNPMYGNSGNMAAHGIHYPPFGQQNLNAGQPNWNFNPTQNAHMNMNPMYAQTAPMVVQQQQNVSAGISLSNNSHNKNQDEFGGFQSANSSNQNVKWLNEKEKGLIDFSDFSSELKKPEVKQASGGNTNAQWEW